MSCHLFRSGVLQCQLVFYSHSWDFDYSFIWNLMNLDWIPEFMKFHMNRNLMDESNLNLVETTCHVICINEAFYNVRWYVSFISEISMRFIHMKSHEFMRYEISWITEIFTRFIRVRNSMNLASILWNHEISYESIWYIYIHHNMLHFYRWRDSSIRFRQDSFTYVRVVLRLWYYRFIRVTGLIHRCDMNRSWV